MNLRAPATRADRMERRIFASLRREVRLRAWLARLEARAVKAREAGVEMGERLRMNLPFVRDQLRLAERKTVWLREQLGQMRRTRC